MRVGIARKMTEDIDFLQVAETIFYAFKDADSFLDSIHTVAVSILNFDNRAESTFSERFERDESLFKDVFLRLGRSRQRVGLAMVQSATEFWGLDRRE